MTREILFKGFHPDENGEETVQINGETIRGEWKYGYYFYEMGAFIKERPTSVSTSTYLVLKSTVSEFTGLTDMNGMKIFENDVIKDDYTGHIRIVIYNSSSFLLKDANNFFYWHSHFDDFEVIGTIFDSEATL
jgi:hypothetical protein